MPSPLRLKFPATLMVFTPVDTQPAISGCTNSEKPETKNVNGENELMNVQVPACEDKRTFRHERKNTQTKVRRAR
jgi:hypothetical protein